MSELKYLFTAYFKDGTVYEQGEKDISLRDEQHSCFFDVAEMQKEGKELIRFELNDKTNIYAVDLQDGHFEINGVPFAPFERSTPYFNRRVVFFRRHYHSMISGVPGSNHRVVYLLGWQANETEDTTSKNHQFVIEFD